MKLMHAILFSVAALLTLPVAAQTKPAAKPAAGPTSSDMEILRQKIKADKKLVVAANMELTDAEAKGFWPVYESYQKELQAINERLAKLIVAYADAYNKGPVSNDTAKKLLNDYLAIEESEVKLKRSYVPRLEKSLPAAKVARYLQIESKIRAVVRYDLASQIPLVQ